MFNSSKIVDIKKFCDYYVCYREDMSESIVTATFLDKNEPGSIDDKISFLNRVNSKINKIYNDGRYQMSNLLRWR